MPRKAFIEDLQLAIATFEHVRIADLQPGSEDGSLIFRYCPQGLELSIQALVADVGDYPSSHMYMIYTTSENVPSNVSVAIENVGTLDGLRVADMLSKVARSLDKSTHRSPPNHLDPDDEDMEYDEMSADPSDPESNGESDHDSIGAWSPRSPDDPTAAFASSLHGPKTSRTRSSVLASNRRIREDLRAVKIAGFRVGHLGGLVDNARDGFVTISIRVSKLGISEEAMQAWHLDPSQYFLLLIRYTSGYRDFDDLIKSNDAHQLKDVSFRVGLSQHYKIPLDEAIKAFSLTKKPKHARNNCDTAPKQEPKKSAGLELCFISTPLQDLMNDRLWPLIRYRSSFGFKWKGAEAWYTDHQGSNFSADDSIDAQYYSSDISRQAATLPSIVTDDHLGRCMSKLSLPLIAMQFALRHLVRCTEFCLVCHSPVEEDFEALKPYVCSKPLCLYQYMSLGFGPSIEHDIVSQPHVVDLLISFCYESAAVGKLKSLPHGLSLSVPAPSLLPQPPRPTIHFINEPIAGDTREAKTPKSHLAVQPTHKPRKYQAKFDKANMELILAPGEILLYPNQWIYLSLPGAKTETFHCRVVEALHPTIRLGPPINRFVMEAPPTVNPGEPRASPYQAFSGPRFNMPFVPPVPTPAATPPRSFGESSKYPEIDFVIYDQNFDDLSSNDQQIIICTLLDTLPSVLEMKEYLQDRRGQDMTLKSWLDRISPAAAGLLRWIIASNRSCIVEVDRIEGETFQASEERVSGMSQWMQFRFAQGAPDKEQRFIQSIRDVTGETRYPTQYAWHGSPLYNWHSIVREGLHFQHTAHGRAFGHGVYHATDVRISLGYSMIQHHQTSQDSWEGWPHSQLRISQAVALNEIVNAPTQFVSSNPHLVVAQLDWIQTRYLFVKVNASIKFDADVQPTEAFPQDPAYTPLGTDRQAIVIPASAVGKSRRPLSMKTQHGEKKMKLAKGSAVDNAIVLSDDTDVEDLQILLSEDEEAPAKSAKQESHTIRATNFVPGTLDHQTLPLLDPPPYATSMATKALQRELSGTLKIQDSKPAHELGWYIDRELISNMYQWIVELHSFESHLPLAKDLKDKGLTSVVMEVRFGKDYPMSPPFVRIIRPRFLSFMAGGGGHVTAGGALCMELLTNSGWSAVSNMESVLLQVRVALSSTNPRPARLEGGRVKDYGVGEAIEAYIRACQTHGWQIPPDFRSSYTPRISDDPIPANDKPLPRTPWERI
ncbi:MAG: hypothetical protein Q9219_001670 [cf. Caloplaca sp. 3 TL-2023]